MKVLLSWLREFVDVEAGAEEIGATLSLRGFALEGLESIGNDVLLDFDVTSNRPDCMNVIGLAREVAAAFGKSIAKRPDASIAALQQQANVAITIENADLCPTYCGAVADVTVGPSPDWMQARLKASGVRPISNIVDITNYVLLEMGQPMHAFDQATLGGNEIRVRTARRGETLNTLDGQTRELTDDMLVIADASQPIAVAGVMGGADTEVSDRTKTIVFESAYFNPLSVRRTRKKLGLKTEASMRFERGADPMGPGPALLRACTLLEEIGAGIVRGSRLAGSLHAHHTRLLLRRARIGALLGLRIGDMDVRHILGTLGFTLDDTDDGWVVSVPTRRIDVLREVDLIEEIARHYGFDRLPSRFPGLTTAPPRLDPRITRARQLRSVLTGVGFSEAVTFGFIAAAAAGSFAAEAEIVPIANPLSETFAVLRPSPLPGLIDAVAHNRRREQRDVRLFEIGNRFTKHRGESRVVACAWTGAAALEHWSGGARDVDFFDMKGLIERIAEALPLEVHVEPIEEAWLVPGRAGAIMCGQVRIGSLGQLSPAVADRHGLPNGDTVYVSEIDLDLAETLVSTLPLTMRPLPRFPSVTRDIAVLLDDMLPAATARATIAAAAPATLVSVQEFDRYQGKGVPEGKVSLALRLTFRSPERTLTDAEIGEAMAAVLTALHEQHGAVQR